MNKIFPHQVPASNTFLHQSTNGSEIAPYGRPPKEHISKLIACARMLEISKTAFGLFHDIAETCLTYSKGFCHKKQETLGRDNRHKPIAERQTRTHERTLIGMGLYTRDENRYDKTIPYERRITDLGIILYLMRVKRLTDPNEMAAIIGRFRKLPVEKEQNCRSHIRKIKEDKEIRDFTKITEKKSEQVMTKPTKATYANAITSQDRQAKAQEQAREHLRREGTHYPIYDPKLSLLENHERLTAYSKRESELMVQYMRQPNGPRPLEIDNVTPKPTGWEGYN